MFNRQYTSRTTQVRKFEWGSPARIEKEANPILRYLKSGLTFFSFNTFTLDTSYDSDSGTTTIVTYDQKNTMKESLFKSFETDDEVGFSYITGIPNISAFEDYFIQQSRYPAFKVLPLDYEAIKRHINMCLESLKEGALGKGERGEKLRDLGLKIQFSPYHDSYMAYFTLPKEVVNPSVIEAPVVKAPIMEAPVVKPSLVTEQPKRAPKQEQNPILRSLKDSLDFHYSSFYITSENNRGVISIVLIDQVQNLNKHMLSSFEKDGEVGFSCSTYIPTISAVENYYIKQKNSNPPSFTVYPPHFEDVKRKINMCLESFKKEVLESVGSKKYSQYLKFEVVPVGESYYAYFTFPEEFITPTVTEAPVVKAPVVKAPVILKETPSLVTEQPISRKRAPKQEAFEPVTPKTRAVKAPAVKKSPVVKAPPVVKKSPVVKAPAVKKTPIVKAPPVVKKSPVVKTPVVKKAPTVKNPPIKLSVAELHIEKEFSLLSSYMDFSNLSPSDVNEIVLSLKPLTDKVTRNDQFAVYDKKLSPSTDKSGFLSARLVAKIILLFKQLDKFYDLSDLEPIELVEVISQILPVFNKLPAFKISPKKASFYRYLF